MALSQDTLLLVFGTPVSCTQPKYEKIPTNTKSKEGTRRRRRGGGKKEGKKEVEDTSAHMALSQDTLLFVFSTPVSCTQPKYEKIPTNTKSKEAPKYK
jgi:hypothetical protein